MTWRQYAAAVLLFSMVSFLAVYALRRIQNMLPLNPEGLTGDESASELQPGGNMEGKERLHQPSPAKARPLSATAAATATQSPAARGSYPTG